LELGGGSPVQVDFEPSIELAHGYRKADISARARPQDRDAPGFENPRRGCWRTHGAGPWGRNTRFEDPAGSTTMDSLT